MGHLAQIAHCSHLPHVLGGLVKKQDKYARRIFSYGANLVSYFRLGDAVGQTVAKNEISTTLNGTTNGVTFGQAALTPGFGIKNKACSFPGTAGFSIQCGNNAAYNFTNSFTLELWMKYTANAANQWFVSKDVSGNRAYSFGLNVTAGNYKLNFFSGASATLLGTTNLVAGTVYHVALTYDGTNARAYVNGVLESAQPIGAPPVTVNNVYLGQREFVGFEEPFVGVMDEVAFYNSVLTAPQLLGNFQAGS